MRGEVISETLVKAEAFFLLMHFKSTVRSEECGILGLEIGVPFTKVQIYPLPKVRSPHC